MSKLQKGQVLLSEKFASDDVRPELDGMNGFSAKIGSIVPLGRRNFPHDPRHFVPGYYRAVPLGQNTLARRGFSNLPRLTSPQTEQAGTAC
jgi:hypothetical protein